MGLGVRLRHIRPITSTTFSSSAEAELDEEFKEKERERETLVTYLDEFFGLAGGPVPVAVVQLEPGLGQLIGLQFQAPPGVLEAGARLVDAPFQLALLAADDFQLCGVCVCACVCVDRRD